MPRILRSLRINDVSAVDKGAGRAVRVMLTKRDGNVGKIWDSNADLPEGVKSLPSAAQTVFRRVANDRMKAGAGDTSAIKQAWSAVKNGWDKKGDTWVRKVKNIDQDAEVIDFNEARKAVKKIDFDDAQAGVEAREDAGHLVEEVNEAICALNMSICSILDDEDVVDKSAAIAETFGQFKDHLAGLEFTEHDEEAEAMTKEEMTAAVNEAVSKAVGDKNSEIAKLQEQLVVAKMTDKHRAFYNSLGDDTKKKKFADANDDDRDELMNSAKKRYEDDPIYKSLKGENEDLRKRLERIEDERELEVCKREVREMGIQADEAPQIRLKVKKGDKEALADWDKLVISTNATLRNQNKELGKLSKAFVELGTSRGAASGGSAMEELNVRRDEYRKSHPELSMEQAFNKVCEDPANRELVARERDERMLKIHGREAA